MVAILLQTSELFVFFLSNFISHLFSNPHQSLLLPPFPVSSGLFSLFVCDEVTQKLFELP